MKGSELVRKLKKYGRAHGLEVRVEKGKRAGKGSHATLYLGGRRTTLKDTKKEIGPGLLDAMLGDLGVRREDL